MSAVVVWLLVVAAVVVATGPAPGARLARLTGPAPTAEARESVAPRWGGLVRHRPLRSRVAPADTAQTVSELAALLRAGVPARQAWQHAAASAAGTGSWAALLEDAARAAATGGDVAARLRTGAARGSPDEQRAAAALAAAWRVAELTGAPTAGVLGRLADALRQDEDAEGSRAAALAGPRATARMLGWLPAAGLGVGQLIGAEPVAVLVGTPLGRVCAVAGAVLAAAGVVWTRRLVRAAEAAS